MGAGLDHWADAELSDNWDVVGKDLESKIKARPCD